MIGWFYISIIPYFSLSSKILQSRFYFTNVEAGKISSLTFIIIAGLNPIIGLLSDNIGLRFFYVIWGFGL